MKITSALTALCVLLFSPYVYAAGNSGITYHGRILMPDGFTPVTDSATQFKMQIVTPDSNTCVMYQEIQTKNLALTAGAFSITINDGTGVSTQYGYTLDQVFGNYGTFALSPAVCAGGTGSYHPNSGDGRALIVLFKTSSMSTWEQMPTQSINFAPMAIEAKQVTGFPGDTLFRVEDPTTGPSAIRTVTPTEATALLDIADGTSTKYVQATGTGAPLPSFATDPSGPTAGEVWYDSANKQIKYYDGTSVSVLSTATNTAITSGTISGTTAVNTSGAIATTGNISGNDITSASDRTSQLQVFHNSDAVSITAPATLVSGGYNLVLPADEATTGQVLSAVDNAGNLTWTTPSSFGTSLTTGDIWVGQSGAPVAVAMSGDATMTSAGVVALKGTGTPGTYYKVVTDVQGRVTSGSTSLGSTDVNTFAFVNGGNSFGSNATLGTGDAHSLLLATGGTTAVTIDTTQRVGVGVAPSALLTVAGSSSGSAGSAGLKLNSGSLLSLPEAGAIEYDGTSLYYTDSSNARHTLGIAGAGISGLSGDVSASGSGTVTATVNKVNGVAYGTAPSTNTVPVVTGANTITYETVPNAALSNSAVTIGSTSVSLGATAASVTGLTSVGFGTTNTITMQGTASSAYNFNLPATAGTYEQVLLSGGGGASAMTWGTLTVGSGGTGLTGGISGGIPYFANSTTMASSAQLNQHAVVIGGGAAAAPYTLAALGTSGGVLVSGGAGADPSFTTLNLASAAAVGTSVLPVTNGGTGATSLTGAGIFTNGGNSFSAAASIGTNDANSFSLKTGGTTAMSIDSSQNVTVGSASSGEIVTVNSTNGTSLEVLYPTMPNAGANSVVVGKTGGANSAAQFGYVYNSGTPANSYAMINIWGQGSGLAVTGNGNVGIGTTNPSASYSLDVAGAIRSGTGMYATGFFYTSDQRLKENIQTIENPIDKIMALRGVNFQWKESKEKDLGFIAQEVETVLPEVMGTRPDKTLGTIKTVKYANIVALAVEAIKETWNKVLNHEDRITQLENENRDLKARLDNIERQLSSSKAQ